MNREVTCILTSCGRYDLLEITLSSFLKFNSFPIKEFFIYEDSGNTTSKNVVLSGGWIISIKNLFPDINWIEPKERTGQIVALDTLWSQVKTPYVFCMEDDWQFTKPGFIELSMEILEAHPNILQVWLKEKEATNKHPIDWCGWEGEFGILKPNHGLWSGTNFSPSLKRKADYDLIGNYGKYTTFNRKRPWKAEADISKLYHSLGFKGAILPQGYIKHIGGGRHVN